MLCSVASLAQAACVACARTPTFSTCATTTTSRPTNSSSTGTRPLSASYSTSCAPVSPSVKHVRTVRLTFTSHRSRALCSALHLRPSLPSHCSPAALVFASSFPLFITLLMHCQTQVSFCFKRISPFSILLQFELYRTVHSTLQCTVL